jgi:hypothetical protein
MCTEPKLTSNWLPRWYSQLAAVASLRVRNLRNRSSSKTVFVRKICSWTELFVNRGVRESRPHCIIYFQLQLGWHPVEVVKHTFTNKQYTQYREWNIHNTHTHTQRGRGGGEREREDKNLDPTGICNLDHLPCSLPSIFIIQFCSVNLTSAPNEPSLFPCASLLFVITDLTMYRICVPLLWFTLVMKL